MQDLDSLARDFGGLFMRLHRLLDRRMAEQGASLARTKLLMFLERNGPARATDIAEVFSLAPRTVTEALDRLERDGLLERHPDEADRRVKRLSITEAGRQAVAATEPLRLRLVEQIFGVLTPEERLQLETIVAKLTDVVAAEDDTDPLCR